MRIKTVFLSIVALGVVTLCFLLPEQVFALQDRQDVQRFAKLELPETEIPMGSGLTLTEKLLLVNGYQEREALKQGRFLDAKDAENTVRRDFLSYMIITYPLSDEDWLLTEAVPTRYGDAAGKSVVLWNCTFAYAYQDAWEDHRGTLRLLLDDESGAVLCAALKTESPQAFSGDRVFFFYAQMDAYLRQSWKLGIVGEETGFVMVQAMDDWEKPSPEPFLLPIKTEENAVQFN